LSSSRASLAGVVAIQQCHDALVVVGDEQKSLEFFTRSMSSRMFPCSGLQLPLRFGAPCCRRIQPSLELEWANATSRRIHGRAT